MSLSFVISEGIAGIRRAKLAFSISVMTLALSISLIGVGIIGVDNLLAYLYSIQSRFDVEVFFQESVEDEAIHKVATIISEYPGVSGFQFLSKEDAANLFKEEFGEDILNILDDNPLPASMRVQFEAAVRNSAKLDQFTRDMQTLTAVGDVIFRVDIFERLQNLLRIVYYLSAATLLILIVSVVLLTSNTIRLMILARFETIETIRLLGASDFVIKTPYFLEGTIQGLLGGLFAVGLIHGLEEAAIRLLGIQFAGRLLEYPALVGGLLLLGITLAGLGSLRAVRRFLQFVV